ncbi:hypothetical protein K438DRAFT_1965821 [Mycena galopus ATCC 62051]|nr:hypothetical protein K438DRAFT_1965821 [Mycena galopus ATCC 62051]
MSLTCSLPHCVAPSPALHPAALATPHECHSHAHRHAWPHPATLTALVAASAFSAAAGLQRSWAHRVKSLHRTYLCRLHCAFTLHRATATSAMRTHALGMPSITPHTVPAIAVCCLAQQICATPLAPRTRLQPTTPPSLPSARVRVAAPLARHHTASTPPFASMSAARTDTHPPLAAPRFTGC